jgi:hypothetical protein
LIKDVTHVAALAAAMFAILAYRMLIEALILRGSVAG